MASNKDSYLKVAPVFALNRIFFLVNENRNLKQHEQLDFSDFWFRNLYFRDWISQMLALSKSLKFFDFKMNVSWWILSFVWCKFVINHTIIPSSY